MTTSQFIDNMLSFIDDLEKFLTVKGQHEHEAPVPRRYRKDHFAWSRAGSKTAFRKNEGDY